MHPTHQHACTHASHAPQAILELTKRCLSAANLTSAAHAARGGGGGPRGGDVDGLDGAPIGLYMAPVAASAAAAADRGVRSLEETRQV